MSKKAVFDSILSGLNEALEDAKKETPSLKRQQVTVIPLKVYGANDVKKIRNSTGLSQKYFASYMGVSIKTVEAWEAGTNHPSGSASRLLHMMELDNELTEKYPFISKASSTCYFSQENHTLLSLIGLYYAAMNSMISRKDV